MFLQILDGIHWPSPHAASALPCWPHSFHFSPRGGMIFGKQTFGGQY
jgi:hypothetical protein